MAVRMMAMIRHLAVATLMNWSADGEQILKGFIENRRADVVLQKLKVFGHGTMGNLVVATFMNWSGVPSNANEIEKLLVVGVGSVRM